METGDNNLPGHQAEALMVELARWGNLTTIVLHGGCVFEFKGPFPEGATAEGYYNLTGPVPGFHGHIRLDADSLPELGFRLCVSLLLTEQQAQIELSIRIVGLDADRFPVGGFGIRPLS